MNLPAKLVSIKDAASFLKVSEKTLRRWEEKNILVPERTSGKHRRYKIEVLSEFKKNKKQILGQSRRETQTSEANAPLASTFVATSPQVQVSAPEAVLIPEVKRPQLIVREDQTISPVAIKQFTEDKEVKNGLSSSTSPEYIRTENIPTQNDRSTQEVLQHIYRNSPKAHRFIVKSYAKVFVAVLILVSTSLLFAKFKMNPMNSLDSLVNGNSISQSTKGEASLKESIHNVLAATSFNNAIFTVNVQSQFNEDVAINAENITSDSSTLSLFNTNVKTLSIGGQADTITVGDSNGTTTVNNSIIVKGQTNDIAGTLNLSGDTLTANNDLRINPQGGAVLIGTETAQSVDLASGDLFVSDDLEVNGTAYIPTLSMNSDTFTDLTGDGLSVSGGVLNAALGTTIESSEITDGTIAAVDLNTSNDGTDGFALTYNNATGGFTWTDISATTAGSGFTDNGTVVSLSTNSDDVTLGSASDVAKLGIVGDSDEIQLLVRGNGTQTSNIFAVQNSSSTNLATIDNSGNLTLNGSVTVGGDTISDFTGNGLQVSGATLTLKTLTSADGLSSTTSNGSGLEVLSSGIGLLQGCSDGQILKWSESADTWGCASDSGATSAVINVENNGTPVGTNVDTVNFTTDFLVSESPSGTDNISIADDALDFSEFKDTMTLDANQVINQGTNTWTQNFTGTTTNMITLNGTSLTTGSALVLNGPAGGTAGITDSIFKLTSNIGDTSTTSGLISSTGTVNTTTSSAEGINLYLNTINSPSTNTNTAQGIYNKLSDATTLGNTIEGIRTVINNASNTGGAYAAGEAIAITNPNTGSSDGIIVQSFGGNSSIGANLLVTNNTNVNSNYFAGVLSQVSYGASASTLASALGIDVTTSNDNDGTITTAYGGKYKIANTNASGTIGTGYGLYIDSAVNSGTFTNNYGLYINDQSAVGSTTSYNLYSAGATAKNYLQGLLEVDGTTQLDGNVSLGNANTDTLTINAGTSGTGITLSDSTFANCGALSTVSNVVTCGTAGGSMSSFTAAGDSGGGQSITNGNTLSILGGTNGIDTVDSATDTITLNLDTTEINDTTFGDNSVASIDWTFDPTGSTSPTLNFSDAQISLGATTAVLSGTTTLTASSLATFTTAATLGMASTTTLNCGDCIDFDDMKDAMTVDAATSIDTGTANNLTIASTLSGGARSTYPLTISQASDGSNDNSVGLLSITNADAASKAALVNIDQVAGGSGISFPTTVSGTTGTPRGITMTVGNGVSASSAIGIGIESVGNSGRGIQVDSVSSGATGIQINPNSTMGTVKLLSLGTTIGSVTNSFTGNLLNIQPVVTFTGSVTNTGKYLNIARADVASGGATTVTENGNLANLSSTCTTASGGTCVDSSQILNLAQNFASATGNVLDITNAGTGIGVKLTSSSTGDLMELDASGAGTTANGLLIQQTGAGTITDAIDVSDETITNAINVGANTILGTTGAIDYTNFDVDTSGNLTAVNITDTGNTILGNANTDTLTINAGTSGTGITLADSTFANCTLTTVSNVLTCGSAASGMTSFTAAGDSGGGQSITNGNTLSILGGTNGIDTVDSATDTITLNLDTTEIGSTTFGSGSAITWTFDASGGTDTTIAFGNNTQTFTTGTATFSSALAVNGNTTIGDASGDTFTFNAGTGTFANDTDITLSGGVNGLSFDSTTLSIDALNNRVGIGTIAPTKALEIAGSEGLRISGDNYNAISTDGTGTLALYGGSNCCDGAAIVISGSGVAGQVDAGDIQMDLGANAASLYLFDHSGNELLRMRALAADSGTTQNTASLSFASPADTTGTNVNQGLNITPTIGNASGGTNTANIVNIAPVTGDAEVTLNAIKVGTLTATGATETAINIGSNWDSALTIAGTPILNSTGVLQSAGLSGTYSNALTLSSTSNALTGTIGQSTALAGTFTTLASTGNTTIGNANTDTLTINAGTSGTGITLADSTFANCTLTTVSNVLTCGSAASGMTSFTAAGDSGGGQSITDGNTLSILGGTNGIDTVDSATDTITLNLDTTEIGTTTFNAGATDPVWTFNTSGATDPTLTFANNQITIGNAATLTATGVSTFDCTDCINFDDIADSTSLDASMTLAQTSNTWTQTFTGTGTTGYTYTANSVDSGIADAISTTALTTGSAVRVTGSGTTMQTGGELVDLVLGANTVGAGLTVTSTGTYTGVGAADGLINVTANGLTSGYGINIPHTTSVIASGGSLLHISSSSVDTTTTSGSLLDLASSGSTAGTVALITNNTASFTGITESISNTGLSSGTGLRILGGTSMTTNGELADLDMGAATAGNGLRLVTSGSYTGTGLQTITADSLTTGKMMSISSAATSGITTAGSNVGSMLDVTESGAMTLMTGSLASINASGANTSGATGNALNINIAGTGQIMKALNITDATTGALTNGAFRLNMTGAHTGNAFELDDVTATGIAQKISTTALTTGVALSVSSTSTALTTPGAGLGSLGTFDWSPGSATNATGDLFAINIGTNGSTSGNLFNITDTGSSLFSVNETQITSALPHQFTAAGDVSIAYDLAFTNQTASYIKSNASLEIDAGEPFESNNLTLTSYLSGNILLNTGATAGKVAIGAGITPVGLLHVSNTGTGVIGKAVAIFDQDETQDILTASASGVSKFTIDKDGAALIQGAPTTAINISNTSVTTDISLQNAETIDNNVDGQINLNTGTGATGNGVYLDSGATTSTANGLCHSGADVDNAAFSDRQIVACAGTVDADFAEQYPVAEGLEVGDVVIPGEKVVYTTGGKSIRQLVKSTTAYQSSLIGVVSDNYSDFASAGYDVPKEENPKPIALVGRVPVKIASTSEAIHAGDYLTSSNEPGRATKATRSGVVIGKALEDWTPESGKDKAMVFIVNTWHETDIALNQSGELNLDEIRTAILRPKAGTENIAIQVGSTESANGFGKLLIQNAEGNTVASVDEGGNATFSGTLAVNTIAPTTDNQSGFGKLLVKGDEQVEGVLSATSIETESASISGELAADTIKADHIISPDLMTRDEIEALLANTGNAGTISQDSQNWNTTATSSGTMKELALENLYVTGTAAFDTATIARSATFGNDLVISSTVNNQQITMNSIDTLNAPLSIQSSATQPLLIMAGLVQIDTQGNVTIAGDLKVAGDIESSRLTLRETTSDAITGFGKILAVQDISGNTVAQVTATGAAEFASVKTNTLAVTADATATQSATLAGTVFTNNATAGSASVGAGTNEVVINNNKVKAETLIFVTATSGTNSPLYVKSKEDGTFTIGTNTPTIQDVTFNWWIVDVK